MFAQSTKKSYINSNNHYDILKIQFTIGTYKCCSLTKFGAV